MDRRSPSPGLPPCPGACDVPDAADCVCETYGAAVYTHPDSCEVQAFYGKPMSSGTDPGLAAQAWIDNHIGAFGLSPTDLQLVRSNLVGIVGKFTVFAYQQYMGGDPVEGSRVRLLVLNGAPDNKVVYVAAAGAVKVKAYRFVDGLTLTRYHVGLESSRLVSRLSG